MVAALYPKSSSAIYGEGDYTFKLESVEKNLKSIYNVNLNGRQKNLYFNSSADLEINLKDKKPNITNNYLSIYNKMYKLELFDTSVKIGQLVEPYLDLYGAKFETTQKSQDKTNKVMFFAGKSVVGTKISTQYGTNSSYALFLLNRENRQITGVNFSKSIHKFFLLQGEYYLDNFDKWGLLLKNSINCKYTTLQTEYSIRDNEGAFNFNLFSVYKTNLSNTEVEYSTINQNTLGKLKSDFKTKNFHTGGDISMKKSNGKLSPLAQKILSYSGYAGYNRRFLEKISSSILYSHSYNYISALGNSKNMYDSISLGISYIDFKSRLSITTEWGSEMAKQQTPKSIKKELSFKRGLGLRYEYQGFRPWVKFNLRTTEEKINSPSSKESTSLSYGISKNINRYLSLSYNCYQTGYKSESLRKKTSNNQINEYLSINYRFPKIPVTLETKISRINKNKPTSFISITYKKKDKEDRFVKYQDEEIKYTRQRPIKVGTVTENMVFMSKELPGQDELLHLGKIIIMVFKDNDFDGNFTEKDTPMKDIKVTLNKTEIHTKEDGKASFIEIPTGSYTFSIDLSELPIGFACKTKAEPIIKIKEGEDIYFNFAIVRSGKINGGVFIDKNRNGIWDEKEKGAENILVYADDTPKYTSPTGKYKFLNIIPGKVDVKIVVPENFEVTTKKSFTVEMLPNQEITDINFGIAEIEPEIEFE